jgi:hypothetical protein
MQYNRNFNFAAGQTIVADQVDLEFDSVASVINGNVDTDNLANGAVTIDKLAVPANPETRFAETGSDFVYSGLTLDPASGWTAAQLTATITAGIAYIGGRRVITSSIPNHAFTASKDTYVDVDGNGTFYYTEAANAGASPTLTSGRMRIAMVKTDANKITSYLTGRILAGVNNAAGTIIARPINLNCNHPYKAKAILSTSHDIADGATAAVHLDGEEYDPNGNFNVTTHEYTVPITGFYQINGAAYVNDASGAIYGWQTDIFVEGAARCYGSVSIDSAQQGWARGSNAQGVEYLTAGQRVSLYGYADTSDAGAVTLNATPGFCFLSIHLLSI